MLLKASNLGMDFGGAPIFENLGFEVHRGDRTALVGVNGSGKTTLLRLMAGKSEPTEGKIHVSPGTRVAYLPQVMEDFPGGPLQAAVCRAAGKADEALRLMEDIHAELEKTVEEGARKHLLEKLSGAQDLADATDAFRLHTNSLRVLEGLGFSREEMSKPLEEFSGGWRMRAMLASLLLSDPDLLLLDEPTNHLDLDARIWLVEYLSGFPGALWVVSHDPAFMDGVVRRVYELELGTMNSYRGNYGAYVEAKRKELEAREKRARLRAAEVEKLEKFIRKFRATESKRFQVRSREKMLERMQAVDAYRSPGRMKMKFPPAPGSGRMVVRLEGVSKYYDGPVLRNIDLEVERGSKIGLVGRNGEGKSTLSRILAGMEKPTAGTVTTGTGVVVGFFSQDVGGELDADLDLLEQLRLADPGCSEKKARTLLGNFLFTGDDVYKPTGVLSGGEKNRLALARLLLSPVNFLVLDEPTNHLDVFSREVLVDALAGFDGTLVLASHDEGLLSAVVNSVWEVGGGTVKPFDGSFGSYVEKCRKAVRDKLGGTGRVPDRRGGSPRELERERKRREAALRTEKYLRRKAFMDEMKKVEEELLPLEERKDEVERLLQDPEVISDTARLVELQKEYGRMSREIEKLVGQWDELARRLDD